jgi:hypothetical protein
MGVTLVSHIKGKTSAEAVQEYGTEEHIWGYGRGSYRRLEEAA